MLRYQVPLDDVTRAADVQECGSLVTLKELTSRFPRISKFEMRIHDSIWGQESAVRRDNIWHILALKMFIDRGTD